jgi:hypothetical protein
LFSLGRRPTAWLKIIERKYSKFYI